MDFAESAKQKATAAYLVGQSLNSAVLDSVENLTKASLASCEYYSNVGVQQLRSLTGVTNVESLRNHMASSISLAGEIAQRAIADTEVVVKAGAEMKDRVRTVFDAVKGTAN